MRRRVADHLRCAACGATVPVSQPASWRCPNARGNDRHHVLVARFAEAEGEFAPDDSDNPFVAFRTLLVWDAFAASLGLSDQQRREFVESVDQRVASVAGTGFRFTPFARHDALSSALGFTDAGGVWVKNETGNVAGSHKARHLFTELLHLLLLEEKHVAGFGGDRPELAIASCGNAAIAASTLAAAVNWPIRVFVPVSADEVVVAKLNALGATVETCPRRDDDPPGDPCVLRFRERVAAGAVPFGVQGPENAWCLDGGRVIGLEMLHQLGSVHMDEFVIQVGGGAFAGGVGDALMMSGRTDARLVAVQTEGCAPLARAWRRAGETGGTANAGARWSRCMWPWETEPRSLADGILDDETYDWISVCDAMTATNGFPVVAPEADVVAAFEVAHRVTDIEVSPTGSAGLAGLITGLRDRRDVFAPTSRVAVVFSGVLRR
jgi:threonine dehydratase